jgi:hypothetical protein
LSVILKTNKKKPAVKHCDRWLLPKGNKKAAGAYTYGRFFGSRVKGITGG